MSKLLLLPVLAFLVLIVAAPTTGAQSVPADDPDCGANAAYDSNTASCAEVTASGQDSSPDQDGTLILDAGLAGDISDPSKGVQPDEDALARDPALVAEARGWTMDEAAADHRAAEIAGRIAGQIAAERPEIFVGGVLSPEPGGAPALYIKGSADDFVRGLAADSEIDITIVDNQPFSFDELKERKLQVHRALEAQGFRYVATRSSFTGGAEITAAVTLEPGLPDDAPTILSGLPTALRANVVLTVSDAPVAVDGSAFGGMQVRDDGANECTSGWSVWNTTGTTGITTAGHCDGINQIVDPSVGVLALSFQGEHRGQWGDVEWHTSAQIEPAQFYSDANTIRWVTAVEARANISQGEPICLYGRSSNARNCTLQVQAVSQACTNDGVFNDRLVLMNGDVGIVGDSGGGWSFGLIAYGSHKGNCADVPGREVFSVADLYDEALGVTVRVKHTLPTGGVLVAGDKLVSADDRFTAIMQTDGNFVLYRHGVGALWASSLCGQTIFGSNILAVMQPDGNFVLYPAGSTTARWATSWPQTQPACPSNQQTVFGSGVTMVMQNDGNLVMYKAGYGAVWASNTCCY